MLSFLFISTSFRGFPVGQVGQPKRKETKEKTALQPRPRGSGSGRSGRPCPQEGKEGVYLLGVVIFLKVIIVNKLLQGEELEKRAVTLGIECSGIEIPNKYLIFDFHQELEIVSYFV